jgi:hypothetical protein
VLLPWNQLVVPNGWLWFIITQPGRLVISSKPSLRLVGVQAGVPEGVAVGLAVAVAVGVAVGVCVAVGVGVTVAVGVSTIDGVGLAVGVGDAPPPVQNFSIELSGVTPSLA